MIYPAKIELPCTCGAQSQVTLEWHDEPHDLRTVPIHCWRCESKIGQAPAASASSRPAAQRKGASLLGTPLNL